jgi:dolichyl-phosphate-mannose--protein O-mannosyl transferase
MSANGSLARLQGRVYSWWKARGPALTHPLTGVLLVVMLVGGIVLRIQNYGYPFHQSFDEPQYAGAASQFMVGNQDEGECCHPPLGKLFIGVGMLLLGHNPEGWRFAPLVFGLQNLVLVYLLASSLFRDRRAGWLAAAFMAADGFYLSYSRASLPDMSLATLVLWSLLAAVTARGWAGVLVCAVLVGLAASIKWVGVLVGLPVCIAILLLKRAPWYTLVSFAVVPLVHLLVWMLGLGLIGQANDPVAVVQEMYRRSQIHLGFPLGVNPLESHWPSWLVMYHPIVIKRAFVGETVRLASSVGNPMLWAAADVCLLGLPVVGVLAARSQQVRAKWREFFDEGSTKAVAILGIAWVSMMLLWFTGRITTYWYHYLTPWGIALTLLGGIVARLDRRYPNEVFTLVSVALVFAIWFAPVWAEFPISVSAMRQRLIFPLWR